MGGGGGTGRAQDAGRRAGGFAKRHYATPLTCHCVAPPLPLPPHAQVREDVTRYRYGDEQHLDEALTRIFMCASVSGSSSVRALG